MSNYKVLAWKAKPVACVEIWEGEKPPTREELKFMFDELKFSHIYGDHLQVMELPFGTYDFYPRSDE